MFSLLLKKALPFTLTLVVGTALSGLFGLLRSGKTSEASWFNATRTFDFHGRCRMRSRSLVAESKPLVVLFKPSARWPEGVEARSGDFTPVWVTATFGADGKVSGVQPSGDHPSDRRAVRAQPVWDAVERAALGIQFEPATVDGVPVPVTREVEIYFIGDYRW